MSGPTKKALEQALRETRRALTVTKAKLEQREELDRARLRSAGKKGGATLAGRPDAQKFSVDRARKAWGADLPDWIARLADACDQTSQVRVAKALGVSAATVNLALGRRYPGRMDRLERRVWAWLDIPPTQKSIF